MILIDMKMPMKCAECPFKIYDECIITTMAVSCESFCRPYFCPLHYEGIDEEKYCPNCGAKMDGDQEATT